MMKSRSSLDSIYWMEYMKTYIKTFIETQKKLEPGLGSDLQLARDAYHFLLEHLPEEVKNDPDFPNLTAALRDYLIDIGIGDIFSDDSFTSEESPPEDLDLTTFFREETLDDLLDQLNDAQKEGDQERIKMLREKLKTLKGSSLKEFQRFANFLLENSFSLSEVTDTLVDTYGIPYRQAASIVASSLTVREEKRAQTAKKRRLSDKDPEIAADVEEHQFKEHKNPEVGWKKEWPKGQQGTPPGAVSKLSHKKASEEGNQEVSISAHLLQEFFRFSPKTSKELFGGSSVIKAAKLDDNTVQYKNLIVRGEFKNDVFIPSDYDMIDVPFSEERKQQATNQVIANYASVIEASVDLVQRVKSHYLKDVYISDIRLQRVAAESVDSNGNLRDGEVEFVLVAEDPVSHVSANLYVTLRAKNGVLENREVFRDTLGRIYKLNSQEVKNLLTK